jgi:hypothetical protein
VLPVLAAAHVVGHQPGVHSLGVLAQWITLR